MPPRKELCRNFQRGSCQYGDRCKFLHATPQQSKPNPFGFGTQNASPFQHTNQQQMPNPFGFGVQNNTQSRGANDFGSKSNQFKAFENKWVRPGSNSNLSASRQPENQPQAAKHQCTDAESCKQLIVEGIENEKPLWKLTCYGHHGYVPCDVTGDISYEELRALAYDDAKHGKSLQLIVDRERSLLNSKLTEFQNLVQKPYTAPSAPASAPTSQNPFNVGSPNAPVVNNGFAPQVSSFSQLGGSLTTGSAAVPNYTFGQPNAFQNNSQLSSSGMFQMNNSPFSSSGSFSGQLPQQSIQSSFSFGSQSTCSSAISGHGNPSSTFANASHKPLQFGPPSSNNSGISARGDPFSAFANSSQTGNASDTNGPLLITIPKNTNVDDSIWKAQWKWNVGEIPEDAPPDIHVG